MNRVMLIYPPGKAYQRGEDRAQCNIDDSAAASMHACNDIGYAASILRNAGYSVFLRDYQTERTTLKEVEIDIKNFLPNIILISITNATILTDIDFVNWISSFHKCDFIFKGAMFFDIPKNMLNTLNLYNINYMIGGEIDTAVGPLVDYILNGKGDIKDIPGVVYKINNKFENTDFDCWNCNLDNVPFPARDLMNNRLYVRPDTGEMMATIQVSRGCPSQCIYCLTPIISGKRVRKRSIENIYLEISECYYKYGIKNFFFKADTFTMEQDWAEELCDKILQSELFGKIEFTVNSRAKPLSPNLLKKLKKAGCFMIAVGFESGNERTMNLIKKGITVEENLNAAKMIRQSGIPLFAFFMIGFPWEDKSDMLKTLKFIFRVKPDFIEIHIALPYLGTELHRLCLQYDTVENETWGKDHFSPNITGTYNVSLNEIKKLRKKYLVKFYLRPSYIVKKFFACISNPKILKNYIMYGFRLINNILK